MKEGILLACMVFILLIGTNAEDVQGTSEHQQQGRYSFDVDFDPSAIFDASSGSMFTMPQIRFRVFQTDGSAYRVNAGFNIETEKIYEDAEGNEYEKGSAVFFSFAPGFEKPLSNGKVRVYYGAELPITIYSERYEAESNFNSLNLTGGYTGIGVNAILGLDYNIGGGFYLGVEFNPGLNYISNSDIKRERDILLKGGNSFQFGTNSSSGIRAGIRF
ncbi:hypothetical protein [Alkalitalea saponilacus]|uniref:Outer membrane protein beta-barrel domain-containing protein n=1 Tax=Alkalitalea saponilacus TaxID=889453 RepID=A0A1T5DH63_9BACT|nr:hypothetical protein [Alkalitalea saponilacus]ASB50695.1 hypothetical protein CDL62_16840 [Alkalitalea saponilacus]SKB71016.1 hypothetical protein SAMN03080601_01107 [Alkalitalea saponilacus]